MGFDGDFDGKCPDMVFEYVEIMAKFPL